MSTTPSTPPKTIRRSPRRALFIIGAAMVSCAGGFLYAKSAAPVARTIELVERDPNVAEFLGSPVSVASVPRKLWRSPLKAALGDDTVTLVTTARGPRGEARISLSAREAKARGWVGSFSVVIEGEEVPQITGCYMIEGEKVVLKGQYLPDGAPVIKLAQKP